MELQKEDAFGSIEDNKETSGIPTNIFLEGSSAEGSKISCMRLWNRTGMSEEVRRITSLRIYQTKLHLRLVGK